MDVRSDANKLPSLSIRAEELDGFVRQFVQQQDIIINALINLDRVTDFDQVDRLVTTRMESLRFEIKTIVVTDTSSCKSSPPTSTLTVPQQFVPLPKIQLPTFDGSLLSWRSFRDVYISLVHDNTRDNTSIGDAERFHYLLSCLSGPALATIKSIPLSANNYAIAWNALSERFDNKRLLASAHLDKLFAFKPITHESLPALIKFVNVFNENVSIIKSLGVNDLSSFLLFHMGSCVLDSTTLQLFEACASQSTKILKIPRKTAATIDLSINRMFAENKPNRLNQCSPLLRLPRLNLSLGIVYVVIRPITEYINVRSSPE